jgi:hypothetical protein
MARSAASASKRKSRRCSNGAWSPARRGDRGRKNQSYQSLRFGLADFTCRKWWSVPICLLSQQTLEARGVPGLYFIGEVVDVTGWLGGYNFQWAWSSGHAAGMAA